MFKTFFTKDNLKKKNFKEEKAIVSFTFRGSIMRFLPIYYRISNDFRKPISIPTQSMPIY